MPYHYRAAWLFIWQSSAPILVAYKTVSFRRFASKKIDMCLQEMKQCFIRSGEEVSHSSNQTVRVKVLKKSSKTRPIIDSTRFGIIENNDLTKVFRFQNLHSSPQEHSVESESSAAREITRDLGNCNQIF